MLIKRDGVELSSTSYADASFSMDGNDPTEESSFDPFSTGSGAVTAWVEERTKRSNLAGKLLLQEADPKSDDSSLSDTGRGWLAQFLAI